jgi:hypothetical protein
MKKFILSLFISTLAVCAYAQTPELKNANTAFTPAQLATIQLSKVYRLESAQMRQVMEIQSEKYNMLSQMESMKTQDFSSFYEKRNAILVNAEITLYNVLTEEQKVIYQRQQLEREGKKATVQSILGKEGRSDSEIKQKIVELEIF